MVSTTFKYLSRDPLYESEKPYSVEFEIEECDGVTKTNYVLSTEVVTVEPIQSSDQFTLDANGFCIINETTSIILKDALENLPSVESAYLSELGQILSRHFPEYIRLEPLEFVVRKRHEQFPSDACILITHEQPACLVHADFSIHGAKLQLKHSFPGQEEYFKDKQYDMINVWKPLVGPNHDWPLAVCDYKSIDVARDIISSDRLHVDRVGENELLFPNKGHCWYYVEGQRPEDLLVFRNIDSTGRRARSFHTAFFNPSSSSPPRQSCEARFVAIRSDHPITS